MKRITTTNLTIAAVVVLIIFIVMITRFAWITITDTTLERFRTTQLQLVTAFSQQSQSTISTLEQSITVLAGREEIQATSATRQQPAIDLLAQVIGEQTGDRVKSITRFNFRGEPIYAYPGTYNAQIDTLTGSSIYPYHIPESLLEMTRRGQRVTGEINIQLYRVPSNTGSTTTLLIAPVDSASFNTEFIAYELDLDRIFSDIFQDLRLGESGQVWVVDEDGSLLFSALPEPSITPVLEAFPIRQLAALAQPIAETYESEGETYETAIARTEGLEENLIVLLSQNQNEARNEILTTLLILGAFAVIAGTSVAAMGVTFTRRIAQEVRRRQAEMQRRQTLRSLLEISRALNSSLDLTVVLQRILAELENLISHESASILLLEDEDELHPAASRGEALEEAPEILRLEDARAASEVLTKGQPITIDDTANDPRWSSVGIDKQVRSWMGIPLRVREELVGVLNINSHQPHRFSQDDVELAETFADQASIALYNARLHEVEVRQIEQELLIARGIQTSLLPASNPDIPQLEIAISSLSAQQVSGDYYQYVALPDGKHLIAVGDVQGKGIPAALLMAVITTALRDEALRSHNPSAIMHTLNTRLLERMRQTNMNSALLLALFDPQTNEFELSNAGMVQPYLRPAQENNFDFIDIGGYPLGISDRMRYSAKRVSFGNGCMMVLFSDGLIEAQNRSGEFFGFDALETLLNHMPKHITAQDVLERIQKAVREHLQGQDPQDDTTIMVLRGMPVTDFDTIPMDAIEPSAQDWEAVPAEDEAPAPVAAVAEAPAPAAPAAEAPLVAEAAATTDSEISLPTLSVQMNGVRRNVELFLPSKLGYEMVARGAVEAMAREVDFPEEQIEDLKTAVAEAAMNAIEHGNRQEINLPVKVLISATPQRIELRVSDTGQKQLSTTLPPPGEGDMRGWGLFLVQNLMDQFVIKHLPDGGNLVYMMVERKRVDEDTSELLLKPAESSL